MQTRSRELRARVLRWFAATAMIAAAVGYATSRSTPPSHATVASSDAEPEAIAIDPSVAATVNHSVLVACQLVPSVPVAESTVRARGLPTDPTSGLAILRAETAYTLNTPEEQEGVERILALLPHLQRQNIFRPKYFCPADFNRDDVIDGQDEALFYAAWSDPSHPLAGWADLNNDDVLDALDVEEFLKRAASGDCDPVETAARRLMVC